MINLLARLLLPASLHFHPLLRWKEFGSSVWSIGIHDPATSTNLCLNLISFSLLWLPDFLTCLLLSKPPWYKPTTMICLLTNQQPLQQNSVFKCLYLVLCLNSLLREILPVISCLRYFYQYLPSHSSLFYSLSFSFPLLPLLSFKISSICWASSFKSVVFICSHCSAYLNYFLPMIPGLVSWPRLAKWPTIDP